MKKKLFIACISTMLIFLLVYASLSKMLSYALFAAQLHTHPLLKPFSGFLAWAVPAVELIIVVLLVIPRTRLTGLYSSAILLLVFTVYLAIMLLTYQHLPCSCGGVISKLHWGGHIVFNSVFIVLSVTGIILYKREDRDKAALSFAP